MCQPYHLEATIHILVLNINHIIKYIANLIQIIFSDVLETSFYFLNIFSHGMLPPHCNQRFLPCEIGCIKYSLKDGIIAEFHQFINPGECWKKWRLNLFQFV